MKESGVKRMLEVGFNKFAVPVGVSEQDVERLLSILEKLVPCNYGGRPSQDKIKIEYTSELTYVFELGPAPERPAELDETPPPSDEAIQTVYPQGADRYAGQAADEEIL